jgi:hypothetical protein
VFLATSIATWLITASCAVSGFSVWGKVEDASSRPVAGVEILLNGKASGTRTNAEGIYRLEGISAGSYTLQVSKVSKNVFPLLLWSSGLSGDVV